MLIATVVTIAKIWNQPWHPFMNKEKTVYLFSGVSFNHKKNDILSLVVTQMEVEKFM